MTPIRTVFPQTAHRFPQLWREDEVRTARISPAASVQISRQFCREKRLGVLYRSSYRQL